MRKNILYSFIVTLLCVFTLSCSFMTESTGTISFDLPCVSNYESGRSFSRNSDEIKFNVIIEQSNGKIIYNEEYPENSNVFIKNLPLGKVKISITCESKRYSYSGSEQVIIRSGQTTNVRIKLSKIEKPEVKPGEKPEVKLGAFKVSFTNKFSLDENPVFKVTLNNKADFNEIFIKENVSKEGCLFNDIKDGNYGLTISGISNTKTYKYSSSDIFEVIGGNTTTAEITLEEIVEVGNIKGTLTGEVPSNVELNVDIVDENDTSNKIESQILSNGKKNFSFDNIKPSTYNIYVNGGTNTEFYSGKYELIKVTAGQTSNIDIVITKQASTSSIKGNVDLPKDVSGITYSVSVYSKVSRSNCIKRGIVNSDGSYTIEGLPIGSYTIKVKGENSVSRYEGSTDVEIKSGINEVPLIKLIKIDRVGQLKVSFTETFTENINVTVSVYDKKDLQTAVKTLDNVKSSGCVFSELKVGTYEIRIEGSSAIYNYSYRGEATVEAEKVNTIEISNLNKTKKTGTLSVIFANSFGENEEPSFTVKLYSEDGSNLIASKQNVNKLGCDFDNIVYGKYKVSVTDEASEKRYEYILKDSAIFEVNKELPDSSEANITLKTIAIPEIKKGSLNLKFIEGPSPAIEVTAKLYKGGVLKNTYSNILSNKTYNISDIEVGTDYKITVSGDGYEFIQENITVNNNQVTEISVKLGKISITPDPSKGIYYVGGTEATDSNNDGSKPFETITAALKSASQKGGNPIINVIGTVNESTTFNVQTNCTIQGVEGTNPKVISNLAGESWLTLSASDIVINNLEISHTSSNKDGFALKIGSGKVTLDEFVKVVNNGTDRRAISVGNSTTLVLTTPSNINASNNIQVLNGGTIETVKGFSSKAGSLKIDMSGVGDTDNRQIIKADVSELAAVSAKFRIIKGKYDINSEGKLIAKVKAANAYYVSDTGNDTNSGKSEWEAFGTISKAIETIQALSSLPKDPITIYVDGDITETTGISIDKNIHIIIETKIGASKTASISSDKYVFEVKALNKDIGVLTLKNISIKSPKMGNALRVTSGVLNLEDGVVIEASSNNKILIQDNGTLNINGDISLDGNITVNSSRTDFIPIICVNTMPSANIANISFTDGAVTNLEGKTIIKANSELSLAEVVSKFTLSNAGYIIDNNGKFITDLETPQEVEVNSFNLLKTAISNGNDVYITQGFEITETLNIDKDISIAAASGVVLKRGANLTTSLFKVNDKFTLTLMGNGTTDKFVIDGGGTLVSAVSEPLIVCYGNLGLTNCILQNNNNTDGNTLNSEGSSGAIYFGNTTNDTEANLIITNTDIINNKGPNGGVAGAITIEPINKNINCNVNIIGSNIKDNISQYGSIAITGDDKTKVIVNINGTIIENNYSNKNGGGIYAKLATLNILNNSSIINNYAKSNGGGIAINNAVLNIEQSTIKDNKNNYTIDTDGNFIQGTTNGAKGNNIYIEKKDDILKINGNPITINKKQTGISSNIDSQTKTVTFDE